MNKGQGPGVNTTRAEDIEQNTGLSELKENHNLWYKIQVLLHDLNNISNDHAAETRTLETTDELYISAPYFSASEAAQVKGTLISPVIVNEVLEFETLEELEEEEKEGEGDADVESRRTQSEKALEPPISVHNGLVTIEEAIKARLENFFEKRRASGDARPCGPHDLGPIYLNVFGIDRGDLRDEKFLSRLRRQGLPGLEDGIEDEREVVMVVGSGGRGKGRSEEKRKKHGKKRARKG